MDSSRRDAFWAKFPGLVWSNSKASDSVMIMAALTRPRFHQLLEICLEFGMDRVMKEWDLIREEIGEPIRTSVVLGMLENIKKGFERAEKTNGRRLEQVAHAA
jgi:hypothetical protein